ncbi:hypothetical protein DM01DRAFT_1105908 [Hesseltinella vesiculosa]|uniref:Uncharacterized protein n=1 Tax=Hesseltinella vesiculosa TaxID=101127 RepID=A0A1X2GAU7_9FUNG|nr:hypothetical protein DM01DRAFT_1105908 [Hesseltinella vesiculosa]
MPFRPRGRGGRRGRPPKRNGHPPQETTPPIKPTEPNLTSTSAPSYKPREERSFKDFFPDLNVHDALIIQQETTEQPPLHMPMTVALAEQHPLNTDPVPSGAQAATTPTPDLSSLPAHPTVNADDDKVSVPSPSPSVQPDAPVLTTWPTSRPLHPKEGDSHQALSTRPQAHLTSAAGSVNLDTLPKPKFSKVIERPKQRRGSRRSSRHQDDQPAPADPADSPVDDTLQMAVYERPDNHYIRYIEPTEQDLYEMVEYDMDEQDEIWLHLLNVERKADNTGEVPSSLFENVMDKLEKEWFDLVKHLPKHTDDEPVLPEDSTCAICDDGECENSNAIVFCDGCNLAVHQDCYGVPYIPEGQWLCRKCMVSPDKPVSCVFCPNEGGAFKQTNTNKWGHLLCAIWIPEVGVSNSVYMEPIDNIEAVPKSRWRLTCYICRKKHGACIQCDNKHCFTAFHVTCARWARLCMRMKSLGTHYDSVVLKAYCDRHTPREYQDEVDVEKCVVAAQRLLDPKAARNRDRAAAGTLIPRRRHVDEYLQTSAFDDNPNDWVAGDQAAHRKPGRPPRGRPGRPPKRKLHDLQAASSQLPSSSLTPLSPSVKAARAHQHHYSAGAPIAPDVILSRLETTCFRQYSQLRKKPQLLATICRYWSLKRESRRGAPLLKRLHLEPWTASSTQLKQTEVERAHRASAIMTLRSDLERIRLLSEQVQKREKQKLDRIRRQKEYLELILYPLEYIVKPIINDLIDMDKKEYFMYPVTPDVAPDYHQVIDKPMCFTDVINKFHAHQYDTLEAIEVSNQKVDQTSLSTAYFKISFSVDGPGPDLEQQHDLQPK